MQFAESNCWKTSKGIAEEIIWSIAVLISVGIPEGILKEIAKG